MAVMWDEGGLDLPVKILQDMLDEQTHSGFFFGSFTESQKRDEAWENAH
jgi:hypothetical protein